MSHASEETHNNSPYLDALNTPQREAVETLDGPLLVLAGAGTGKTRVLTTRLIHLLNTGKAYPSQILAVTFTNKAAQEMRNRVANQIGQQVEGWWLGTFHALAARMLRRHAEHVGLTSNFTILDADDQVRLVKQLMEVENIDTKKWPPKNVAAIISRWKDRGKVPSDISQADAGDYANGRMIKIYTAYQERMQVLNACDFADLLLHMITIFKKPKCADILADYHRRFKYILVDEYQDTNVAQYLWLRLLAQGTGNICCVGDDDQSIYGWRGAEVGNILRFERDFKDAKVVRLEQNYRSTGHILEAASAVIANNEGRLGKTLWSASDKGDKVNVRGLWDGEAEARFVGEEIESFQRKGVPLNQIAVLVRAGFQMREFEERFIQLGVPYRVIGGPRFYERKEIRDALAYLRVTAQSADDLALERIINTPKRGIGDATIQKLYAHARAANISLYQSMVDLSQTEEFGAKIRTTLSALVRNFENWRDMLSQMHHAELAAVILDESGYTAMWQADKSPDAEGRLENLKELVSAMQEFENMEAFLEHIALVLENQEGDNNTDQVTLMTLHGAKGLEFDVVFLPGWEDGVFPSQRSLDENGNVGLEEERRLAYVGITRARKRSIISHVANRRMYGKWVNGIPSRFVEELPETAVEIETEPGLYGGGARSNHWDSSGWNAAQGRDRFRPNQRLFGTSSGGTSQAPTSREPAFSAGDIVRHDSFGEGRVIHVSGNKLDIEFKGGTKRVLSSFIDKVE